MQNENDIIRQFQLIDEEMNAFYEATAKGCKSYRGAKQKEFLLQQLQKLKDKVHEIETRALAIYSNHTAENEGYEKSRQQSIEVRLKAVQMCCSALVNGFMHEFDLFKQ